jgi:hypothetical protein
MRNHIVFSLLLATDEPGFTRDGVFNTCVNNTHVWSDKNHLVYKGSF